MITRIGNTPIQKKHKASCHCGAVVLELTLPDGVVDPRRCDCSFCRRRGAIVASVPLLTIRTRSMDGMRWQIICAISTSRGLGVPKLSPLEAAPQTAAMTTSGAWPRMAGPHVPT